MPVRGVPNLRTIFWLGEMQNQEHIPGKGNWKYLALRLETHMKRQATQHGILPGLLGDGDKRIKK
jgi:hypothetical protein